MTIHRKQTNKTKTTALVASAVLMTGVVAGCTTTGIEEAAATVPMFDGEAVAYVPQTNRDNIFDTSSLVMIGGGRGGRGGHGGGSLPLDGTDVPEVDLVPTPDPNATLVPQTEEDDSSSTDEDQTVIEGAQYVDGQYYGDSVAAHRWGNMQVVAVIEDGELTDVLIADYPRNTTQSDLITRSALPTLISEAIEAQSADIDIVTRATDSSVAFIESLESALEEAAVSGSNL